MGCMNDTGPTALQWLLHEVDSRLPAEHAGTVRAILTPMIGQALQVTRRDLVMAAIRADADRMLAQDVQRSLIAVRLSRTHDVSMRTATRYVTEAMARRAEGLAVERVAK